MRWRATTDSALAGPETIAANASGTTLSKGRKTGRSSAFMRGSLRQRGNLGQGEKEAIHNNMDNYRAGILTAGEARARSIPEAVCNERATKPAVKRPSESVHVIVNGLRSCREPRLRSCRLKAMPFGNSLAPVGGPCPEGTSENSPAFQRWVLRSNDPKSRRDGREPA